MGTLQCHSLSIHQERCSRTAQSKVLCIGNYWNPSAGGGGGLVGRWLRVGNLAFQIFHAKSRGVLHCPPVPLCFACPMSHSLFLASAKLPTAKLTRHQSPPPPRSCAPFSQTTRFWGVGHEYDSINGMRSFGICVQRAWKGGWSRLSGPPLAVYTAVLQPRYSCCFALLHKGGGWFWVGFLVHAGWTAHARSVRALQHRRRAVGNGTRTAIPKTHCPDGHAVGTRVLVSFCSAFATPPPPLQIAFDVSNKFCVGSGH